MEKWEYLPEIAQKSSEKLDRHLNSSKIFCTQETLWCISMNAILTTIYLIQKIKQRFFLYYISCKENKCWKSFKIMRKLLFKYSLYSHPEIENFRVWHLEYPVLRRWLTWRGNTPNQYLPIPMLLHNTISWLWGRRGLLAAWQLKPSKANSTPCRSPLFPLFSPKSFYTSMSEILGWWGSR
jgi:hypothetical protein